MFAIEQLTQLHRVGALELRQIAVRGLLRAPDQVHQIVGALLAEGFDEQSVGIVDAAVHDVVLRLEQLPELLENIHRNLRLYAAQVGQFLGEPLHVGFGQRAKDFFGQILAHRDQQDCRLARALDLRGGSPPRFAIFPAPVASSS